jgi:hypothetical protein
MKKLKSKTVSLKNTWMEAYKSQAHKIKPDVNNLKPKANQPSNQETNQARNQLLFDK